MALDDLQNYIIGVILFVLVITSGVVMLGTFNNSDNTLDTAGEINAFNNSLNKASEVTLAVGSIQESIDSVGNETNDALGWLNVLVGSAYNGVRAVGGSMSFMTVAMADAARIFGIPSFVVGLVSLIVVVIIVFAIWSIVVGRSG
jgi:hypothetical protein